MTVKEHVSVLVSVRKSCSMAFIPTASVAEAADLLCGLNKYVDI